MKKFIFADFLLALLLLVAAEAGVRIFMPHDVSGRFSYGYDQDSGFVESQDGLVHLVRAGGHRFHPQTFRLRRPADTYRIMVIGDSVPRGPSFKGAYAYQLQEILRERGIKAEVINLALPGFGARRKDLVLRKVLSYEPSLIILHVNDSNEYEDEREYRRSQDFKGWHPRQWLMKSFIFARAYEITTEKILWRLLPEKIRERTAVNDADAKLAASHDKEQERLWQQRVWQKTAEDVELARLHTIPIILVTQVTLDQKPSGKISLDDHNLDAMARNLAGPGVYVVSMKDIFSAVTPVTLYFSDFSHHLTAAGHEVMARDLADLIGSRLALKNGAQREGRGAKPGKRQQNCGLAPREWRMTRLVRTGGVSGR
jgi:hypothetical protein